MSEDGKCLLRGFGYLGDSSILLNILILTAFTLGVCTYHVFRSVFGVVWSLNQQKSSSVKSSTKKDELPKLPATVRIALKASMSIPEIYLLFSLHSHP